MFTILAFFFIKMFFFTLLYCFDICIGIFLLKKTPYSNGMSDFEKQIHFNLERKTWIVFW